MITRYDFMKTVANGNINYPDCLTLDMKKLSLLNPQEQCLITETDFYRPDIFFYRHQYSNNQEDIAIWSNGISSRRDLLPGITINLPDTNDLDSFYLKNRVSE